MKTLSLAFTIALISFAAANARAACGVLEVSKGDVKIEAGQTKQTAAAGVGAKICSGDTVIAGADSRAKIKMEDGNELNISPDSKIVLENYQYNAADNKKKVLLNVLQGKVRASTKQENMYNDKSRDGADNSFQVKTKSAVAGVRGTDFLTSFDVKSNKSEVVTFRGKVEFGQIGAGGKIMNPVQVGAGQKTEAVAGQPPAPPKAVPAAELKSMNTETKADTAAGGSGGAGASNGDKKSDKGADDKGGDKSADKGGGDKAGDKSASSDKGGDKSSGGSRSPASAVGGSMVDAGTLGGDPSAGSSAGKGAGAPAPPTAVPLPIVQPAQQVYQPPVVPNYNLNLPTKLNVRVTY